MRGFQGCDLPVCKKAFTVRLNMEPDQVGTLTDPPTTHACHGQISEGFGVWPRDWCPENGHAWRPDALFFFTKRGKQPQSGSS